MKQPKNNKREDDIPQFRDVRVENGIKWSLIAQSLVVLSVSITVMLGGYFGSRVLDTVDDINLSVNTSMEKISETLIGIRREVSLISTGTSVNSTRIDSNVKDIDAVRGMAVKNSDDIKYYIKDANNGKN